MGKEEGDAESAMGAFEGLLQRFRLVDVRGHDFGSQICEVGGIVYFSFPSLTELKLATEAHLRALKFGYRARYIV